MKETDWNVFIEGPPHGKNDPRHVLKYLTRYMTGGPISDRRIESDDQGMVTFTARSKSKQKNKNKQPRRIQVPGAEFVRRWSLHVLPRGFTRSRSYGGYHGSRRQAYLETCRQLLPRQPAAEEPVSDPSNEPLQLSPGPTCPQCQIEMECIMNCPRPGWRDVLGPGQRPRRHPDGRIDNHRLNSLCHLPRPET